MPDSVLLKPVDGISLKPLFDRDIKKRESPIGFRYTDRGALIDNDFKLVATNFKKDQFELYNLADDPKETNNISTDHPEIFSNMKSAFKKWNTTVDASIAGKDYPEGEVSKDEPQPHFWMDDERYKPFFEDWKKRPEYAERFARHFKQKSKKRK